MKILILFFCSISLYAQSGWIEQVSGSIQNLTSIFFVDINKGFIVGSAGTLLKTTDGGTTWNPQSIGTSNNLTTISFIDSINGFILGSNKTYLKTSDSGINWLNLSDSLNTTFASVSFLNLKNGIGIDESFSDTIKFYHTSNGGENWNFLGQAIAPYGGYVLPWYIHYVNENTILAIVDGTGAAVVYQSIDGGATWSTVFGSQGPSSSYNKAQFINLSTGFLLSHHGLTSMYHADVYKTLNGGTNWAKINNSTLPLCRSIFMLDENNGYVVGNDDIYLGDAKPNAIYQTSDGGVNWIQQISNTTKKLNDLYFIDLNTGIVIGDSGIVLRTINGGVTSIREEVNSIEPSEFNLSQNYPNPFNPSTKIIWQTPISGWQTVKVYDVLGNEVATLVNEYKPAGSYEVEFNASNLPSGVYFYQLKAGDYLETKKMILLK